MQRVNILIAGDMPHDTAVFRHGDLEFVFHHWAASEELPLLDGRTFAFIAWLLPDMPGIEACRRLRCDPLTAQSHITIVLRTEDRDDRRRALGAGADDYMLGPLDRTRILDRILSLKRPAFESPAAPTVRMGDLAIDIVAFQVRWREVPISLLPNDLRLLRYFVEHPGRIFTRAQLIAALGKHNENIDERTVDVWVGRLRRALKKAGVALSLRTVRSLGYVLDKP